MGTMANDLSLGCDCLGKIHYLVRGREIHYNIAAWLIRTSAWLFRYPHWNSICHKECNLHS